MFDFINSSYFICLNDAEIRLFCQFLSIRIHYKMRDTVPTGCRMLSLISDNFSWQCGVTKILWRLKIQSNVKLEKQRSSKNCFLRNKK